MAVELIPKKPTERPWWQPVLFYLSLGLLVLSVASFFIVSSLAKKEMAEKDRLNHELAKAKTADEITLESRVFKAQRQVTAFGFLIDQQKPVSRTFAVLEKLVHPQAYFSKFNFVAKENKVWVAGVADNFRVLGEQSLLFKSEKTISQANLSEVGIGKEGGVEFSFEIFFDPSFFAK